ncbi:hypothetical protein G5V59_18460 [Nocardioides sp. W3-2-3]|nr:hypothetical protein [Nocardioides convexus]
MGRRRPAARRRQRTSPSRRSRSRGPRPTRRTWSARASRCGPTPCRPAGSPTTGRTRWSRRRTSTAGARCAGGPRASRWSAGTACGCRRATRPRRSSRRSRRSPGSLRTSKDLDSVDIYETTGDAVSFTYRDSAGRLRYDLFRWVPDALGRATLEISVAGRGVDKDGLSALLDKVATDATESR